MVWRPSLAASPNPTAHRCRSTARLLLLLTTLLAIGLAPISSGKKMPVKRTYDTHSYYVLELDSTRMQEGATVYDIADALAAEHVEQVGELEHHYLIRAPYEFVQMGEKMWNGPSSPTPPTPPRIITDDHRYSSRAVAPAEAKVERDSVMERYQLLRRWTGNENDKIVSRSVYKGGAVGGLISAIRSLERQHPRLRVKRDLPVLPPSLSRKNRRATLEDIAKIEARQTDGMPPTIMQKMATHFGIIDPLWPRQWHLVNGIMQENMINVTGVWDDGVFGKGINVAIVDDGLDMHSDDLAPNFHAEGSWDYNDNTALPEPRLSDDQHGTRCAGEIAAAKNDVCGVGVAYEAGIAGIRILSASISDADEASALNYGFQTNDIYSCSWGPPDDGRSMEAPGRLIVKAMMNGVQNGRNGKGSIFVFASGNGGAVDDQCNFDGYTNSLMSITVGAIDRKGLHPFYSEACAAIMVVTYSSGSGDNIHTTDVGKATCTDRHGGTSAAAPIAAGILALVLEVRPDLTWRDIQHLCVHTAVQINPQDPDWQMTASGRNFNHKYGFGKLDAWAVVNAARTWQLVNPQAWWTSPTSVSGAPVDSEGATSVIRVSADDLKRANFDKLEHVTVTVHIDHQRRGNVEVELLSPKGMKSILARPRRFDDADTGLPNWKFMTVKHWDEDPVGVWNIRVFDRQTNNFTGRFNSWSMHLWGSSIDASIAKPYVLPDDPYDPDVPVGQEEETPTDAEGEVPPSTTAGDEDAATKTYVKPTAHLPDDHAQATGEAHLPFGDPTSDHVEISNGDVNDTPVDMPGATTLTAPADPLETPAWVEGEDDLSSSDRFGVDAPSYLAHMSGLIGSSTWLFVAGGTIIVFVGAVTAFFLMRSRRARIAGRNGAYDFAPTDDEDLPMSAMERGRMRMGSTNARTRDLFDAFALRSDEEDDDDDDDDLDDGDDDDDELVKKGEKMRTISDDVPYSDNANNGLLRGDDNRSHEDIKLVEKESKEGEDEELISVSSPRTSPNGFDVFD